MKKATCILLILGVSTPMVMAAAPTSFVDDFQTVTTYNHQTYIDACAGTPPDWTIIEALGGETYYERAVRGGGKLRVSNWEYDNSAFLGIRIETIYVGWAGGVIGCLGEPATGRSNKPFTHDDLCIYGGVEFTTFQLTSQGLGGVHWGRQYGGLNSYPGFQNVDDDGNGLTDDDPNCDPNDNGDGQPGVAGVDDDGNGKTDDPGDYWFGTNCGADDNFASGGPSGEYLAKGLDGMPGTVGVDDDGNGMTDFSNVPGYTGVDDDEDGTTDELGLGGVDDDGDGVTDEAFEPGEFQFDVAERGFGDDSDDISGEFIMSTIMRQNLAVGSLMSCGFDPRTPSGQFAISDVVFFQANGLAGVDEIGAGFYQPNTRYNYAFCASGSVYGAQLWIENDVGNIVESLGPIANTDHLSKTDDLDVSLHHWQLQNGNYTAVQNAMFTTNSTFGNKFQVLEGNILPIVPQDRDTDGDVDGVDFSVFASCFNKAGNPPRTLGCSSDDGEAFDADGDGDVDGVDFSVFASCFNKAGNSPREAGCLPDLTGTVPDPNANDLCADATVISAGQLIDKITSQTTIEWGGDTATTGNCSGDDGGGPDPGQDLWYEYSPACAGTAVTVTASTANSGVATITTGAISDDTHIAIFDACPPSLATLLSCVNVNGFGDSGKHGPMSVVIDQTTLPTVIIAVVGDDNSLGDRGQFALDVSCTP